MNVSVKNTLLAAAGTVAALTGSSVVASADSVTVKAGDTLYAIATAHNTTVNALASANGLSNINMIFVGQQLQLPGTSANNAAPATNNNASANTTTSAGASNATYTVKAGDSLWGIANSNGMTLSELLSLNDLQANSYIFPGDSLKISGAGAATATPSAPATDNSQSSANTNNNWGTVDNGYTNSNNTVSSTNTYPYGQCTWYVKGDLNWVGNYWGNAVDWASTAVAAGHTVNSVPTVGSIAYFAAGVQGASSYGHVAVVDSVNADGTVTISEANYAGMLYHERTIPTSGLLFIHQ
ncbi:LysM peptidoglycan-binding domain-containing protein [Weissella cibaria]|uniref:Sle1 protein n=1 Tax=Weissella cibaria TaxID=137591 RepID=A0A0D1M1Q6_9LACO|nr:LysM peptidoglycan-binding domain-containing protein [Weissella cibaria]HCT89638.1 LysM peptidoglycan-binding domain-containing protein [Acinetobacter pittii]ALI32729.1 N-acetylmuramoyl-L-alanine amidase [Weissella cibaria]KIU21981.1 N-acetylmuramoyl-L-alanine amidase sle1 precursor [Weissella cibaria]KIU22275.1 N-acetylmuramoyl-L-alanine amidase sle1 precursor [Weissella cibaria]MBD1501210.1 LysM peptidoglycan-binding domain-containing protein [Weissella cibaria]